MVKRVPDVTLLATSSLIPRRRCVRARKKLSSRLSKILASVRVLA